MSPVRVTWARTLGRMRNLYTTALALAGFLACTAVAFAFNLDAHEGGRLPLAVLWATSVAPFLPALVAFLAMDVWSEERQTGHIDALLSAAVRERDYVAGKFLGVWTVTFIAILLNMLSSLSILLAVAPMTEFRLTGFLPGLVGLALQSALWCAVSVALSVAFVRPAAAAFSALVLTVALPRGIWAGLMAWSRQGRPSFGEMPLDAHIIDMASGMFTSATLCGYVVLSFVALLIASKLVASLRFVGRGALRLRLSTACVVALSLVFAALAIRLAIRLDAPIDLQSGSATAAFSHRTRDILSETDGEIAVTCFLPRNDARFRETAHFLRAFAAEARAVGGVGITLRFVDPRWDLGAAERLVRQGVRERSVVFEKGSRTVAVPLDDGFGERVCASTVLRVTMPPQRRNIYWTIGHGEVSHDAYGSFGMSDIARELSREGYRNVSLDLAQDAPIPADCALVIVAGAKDDFSRAELGRLDAYLRDGGRLLVLLGASGQGGAAPLLPSWGVRPTVEALVGAKTLSGSDVIVSDFSDHAISEPLRGSRLVLEKPVAFAPSAAIESGAGVSRIEYAPVASVGGRVVAAAIERGAGTGSDLALRPTRIVAVGDVTFALNGQLVARANANRDFFLNCVAFLSGTDASSASGTEADAMVTGLDREGRIRLIIHSAGTVPGVIFLVMVVAITRRRRRS